MLSAPACCQFVLLLLLCPRVSTGFVIVSRHQSCKASLTTTRQRSCSNHNNNHSNTNTSASPWDQHHDDGSRRNLLATISTAIFSFLSANSIAATAMASSGTADTLASSPTTPVEMKTFIDPAGLFVLNIPQRFFALRRSAKGDLPDAQTGTGRRGSTIFSAGDMAKAEVVSIEYFPVKVLLQDFGIDAGTGSLQTIPDIGEPSAVANLIAQRRDKDRLGAIATKIIPNTVTVSSDGRELAFQLKTAVPVQKPELLLEQYGVTELFRITAAKASLIVQQQQQQQSFDNSKDGNNSDDVVMMMVAFASALETDWKGPDGVALQESVQSFRPIHPANLKQ